MLSRSDFRKASNYYVAQGSEWLRPLLRNYSQKLSGAANSPTQWRRGLLLGAAHIGDLLYRSSSLAALKRGLPDCDWYFLAESGPAEVLRYQPALAGIIEGSLPQPGSRAFFQLASRLRSERFDTAICYDAGRYWPPLLLATHAGISNRVGYVHKGFSGLVTHPIPISAPQPYPAYFRDLVATLTGQPRDWSLRPTVSVTTADETVAEAAWQELVPRGATGVIACFVTTRQPHGQWPREQYGRTLRILSESAGLPLLLCGAAADKPVLEELKNAHALDCPIMAGRLGLRPLVAFLRRCAAVFTTDSGPRHLANAAGVPVFFMRNLWSPRIETGAYLDTETDLAPDFEQVAPGDEPAAFAGITPESVAARVLKQMGSRTLRR